MTDELCAEIDALRAHLVETRRSLAFQQREARMLADQLEHATVVALRAEASIAELKKQRSRDDEVASAKQWLSMSEDLAELRARVERYEQLLSRLHARMDALLALARGTELEAEVHDLFTILDIHAPASSDERS